MARQLVKGLTMLALLLTLALAATATTANGQDKTMVRANVPFEFVVGDKTLPAGEYVIRAASTGGDALAIQDTESNHKAVRLTNSTRRGDKSAALVFHRYGECFFLSQVWLGGNGQGRQLLKSRQQRAIERELSRIAANRITTHTEVVLLASTR